MRYYHSVLALSVIAAGMFDQADLIGWDDKKITADDAPVQGIAQHPATEIGLDIAVTAIGYDRVRANGPITKGQRVISAAAGGVKAAEPDSVNDFATALTTAADGEFVTVLIR
ncbi:hypothetical protein [Ochrobactrum chromiisoli]|uniref:DUF2190 domain-containing protein n=1 Tax=Ochrobactrum chromiisoli TaxID=2993941 RepID=A0ABT3QNB3_9HYPH|nr:hypothetical protein [Ochrobactrum chromiisoli]MCX2697067.1 hypothetical protein [Ochrobactrum chromiisoli]